MSITVLPVTVTAAFRDTLVEQVAARPGGRREVPAGEAPRDDAVGLLRETGSGSPRCVVRPRRVRPECCDRSRPGPASLRWSYRPGSARPRAVPPPAPRRRPSSSRAVSAVSVWSGRMTSRSRSGAMSKSVSTWSSRWRCCAVASTRTSAHDSSRSPLMTGAILIASGRVPTTQSTFACPLSPGHDRAAVVPRLQCDRSHGLSPSRARTTIRRDDSAEPCRPPSLP